MSASTFSRRTLLTGASALAGMASLPAFAQGGSIKVATWGGSWRDSLDKSIGEKIRAGGGTVDYVVDTPQGNLAKLVADHAHDFIVGEFEHLFLANPAQETADQGSLLRRAERKLIMHKGRSQHAFALGPRNQKSEPRGQHRADFLLVP